MNCQPGDLARVIDTPGTRHVGHVDRFLRLTESYTGPRGVACWLYEGPMLRCMCPCGSPIESFADEVLRPIRNPGDDAVDETLLRLPAPTQRDEVPA
ncbi:hypothetical protein [Variovorax sp.]|uniref:hypothetical protein n=1 Tax=Variovorax sp. TaxID=1871043 RepID=UPI003BA9D1FC